jgi:alpha 1,6-mannosyltransferase
MLSTRRAILIAALLLSFVLILRHSLHASNAAHEAFLKQSSGNQEKAAGGRGSSNVVGDNGNGGSNMMFGKDGGRGTLGGTAANQIPLEKTNMQTLRKQLAFAYPYRKESKFPAYIWQTWKHDPSSNKFPEQWRPAEASWTELNSDFVHEVITDDVASSLIQHLYASVPEIHEAYTALPRPVLKADFFRYLILLARGGIYSDIDTVALKPATQWIPGSIPRDSFGLVIGIEADPDRPDWQDWYSRRIQFCQWTIQAKPGHPVLVDVVASIAEETLRLQRAGKLNDSKLKVIEFTGPAVWTDAIFDYFNNPAYFDVDAGKNVTWRDFTGMTAAKIVGDVVVLPITSFSPGVNQMGAGELDDPMAFVQHTFEGELSTIPCCMLVISIRKAMLTRVLTGSWKPESERHIGE